MFLNLCIEFPRAGSRPISCCPASALVWLHGHAVWSCRSCPAVCIYVRSPKASLFYQAERRPIYLSVEPIWSWHTDPGNNLFPFFPPPVHSHSRQVAFYRFISEPNFPYAKQLDFINLSTPDAGKTDHILFFEKIGSTDFVWGSEILSDFVYELDRLWSLKCIFIQIYTNIVYIWINISYICGLYVTCVCYVCIFVSE